MGIEKTIKKRLKRIEAVVRAFPAEKWLIDRIVELSAEQVEQRLRGPLQEVVERTVRQVGEEIERRMPNERQLERLIEEAVQKAMVEHERTRTR